MDRLIHSEIRLVQIRPLSSARPAHTPVDRKLVQPPVRASPDPLLANPLARSGVAGVPGEVTSLLCCPQCPGITPAATGPPARAFVRKTRAGRARGLLDGHAAATRAELPVQVTQVRLNHQNM